MGSPVCQVPPKTNAMNDNALNLLDLGVWFFLILAFLVGYLTAYFISRAKVAKALQTGEEAQQKLLSQESKLRQGLEQAKRYQEELKDLGTSLRVLDTDYQKNKQVIVDLQTKLEKANAAENSYKQTIESLNQQILQLHRERENLEDTLENTDRTAEQLTELQTLFNASKKKIDWLEERLQKLEPQSASTDEDSLIVDAPVIREEPKLPENQDPVLLSDKIVPEEQEKDDFTRIEGIGPFIQSKLYEQGIISYRQLAAMEGQAIRDLARAIRFLPDRIASDNWTGQASRLLQLKNSNPEAFEATRNQGPDPDDLSIIAGITPQLESILQEAGIKNWKILADAEIADLRSILDMSGDNYKDADPASWPAQAKLAVSGQWELLEEFKRELENS